MREAIKSIFNKAMLKIISSPNFMQTKFVEEATSEIEALFPKIYKFVPKGANAPENDGWYFVNCPEGLLMEAFYSAKEEKWFDSGSEIYREEIKGVKYYTYKCEIEKLIPKGE